MPRGKGTPKTGGRAKGTPNKATADIKAIAQKYTATAIEELVKVLTTSESDPARVAAAREILDRGYGKPSQAISGDPDGPAIEHTITVVTGVPRA